MITEKLNTIFNDLGVRLSTALSKPNNYLIIESGDQTKEIEKYPYGSYKILNTRIDPEKSATKKVEPIIIHEIEDPDKYNEITSKGARVVISLSFLHDKSLATCMDLAQRALDWFDSLEGMNFCETHELTPNVLNPEISDRTIVLDTVRFDYRVGFDFQFVYRQVKTEEKPKTKTVGNPEFKGEI